VWGVSPELRTCSFFERRLKKRLVVRRLAGHTHRSAFCSSFSVSRYGVEHGPQHVFNFSSQGCVSNPNRSYSRTRAHTEHTHARTLVVFLTEPIPFRAVLRRFALFRFRYRISCAVLTGTEHISRIKHPL